MKRKLFAVSMAAAMATSCFAGTAFASDSEPVTIKSYKSMLQSGKSRF